ncbi:DegV family protein [Spiroplasma endosymbiont of Crioceris asparagi]|uniref:DegV family protein n=1 Tax=Spiroplasma endosymbiont of Crioceris asparagi TaxID=3066286 RepID=UPI0030CF7EAE
MKKIGILIDSSSGITEAEIKDTNIELIPLTIVMNGTTEFDDTKENAKKHDLLKVIDGNGKVTTSLASQGKLENKYSEMLKEYEHIFHIAISEKLSSMKKIAFIVSKDKQFDGRITLVDETVEASTMKYLALALNEKIQAGLEKHDDVINFIKDYNSKTLIMFIPGDIKRLAKSGRGTGILASFLSALNTKVLIAWGAQPKRVGMTRKMDAAIQKAIIYAKDKKMSMDNVIYVKSKALKPMFDKLTKERLIKEKINYVEEELPSVFACHAGVNSLALMFLPKSN